MASQNSNPNADPVFFGGIEVDITQFDFSDHSSKVNSLTITCAVFIALVVSTVGLRLFARGKYVGHIFADDVLIICAAVFTVALAGVCIAATQYGLGRHIWLLPVTTLFDTLKDCILYLFICQILYAFAIALTKIAIVSSYLRFIHDRTFRIWMYAISVIIAGLWISGIFVTIFQCRPVQGAWDFTLEPVCVDYVTYLYASSAVNVTTDILLCALPLPHIWRLKMPKRQRIVLCVLLAGGARSEPRDGHVRLEHIPTSQDKDKFTSESKQDLSGSYGSHTQVSA
ncbi:hypothetical protein J4E91_008049 [Alternaria rosae]|nr:hypothetical protein J4E91_008049 [Alternaria rosae]